MKTRRQWQRRMMRMPRMFRACFVRPERHPGGGFRGERGFSLVEVMIAMVLFAITSMGITTLMVTMIGSNDYAKRFTEAVQLGEDKLEELKNECCLVIAPGADQVGKYARSWHFLDDDPVSGMMQVVVTVSWQDERRRSAEAGEHSTTLVSLMLP